MRNLKRVLSLTLASVMLMGMMVVGSAAAGYDDVAETDNVEAIEVLQAIEVMVGDERGFGPERPVNRAEMAVVMGKLLSLDYNYYTALCPFTDVYDWAQGWVGACYANKIVSGRGDGIYDPSATVTAVEAASMLMRALGYFQYQNDYGDSFELSTVTQGKKIGIFDNVGSSANEPMTRNQVAQMVLNALQSAVVEPDGNTINLTTPDGSVITGKVNYVSVTSKKTYSTAISDIEATSIGSTNDGWIVELGEQLYDGDLKLHDDDDDIFMRPARTWEYKGQEIGTYMKKENIKETYTTAITPRTLYDLLGRNNVEKYGIYYFEDGEPNDTITRSNILSRGTNDYPTTGRGVLTQVFVDIDKERIDITSINTYLAKATVDYNETTEKVTLEVYANYDKRTENGHDVIDTDERDKQVGLADVENIAGLKQDDYVLVNVSGKDNSTEPDHATLDGYDIVTVSDVEIMAESKLTKFSKDSDNDSSSNSNEALFKSVVTGGTEYKSSKRAYYSDEVLDLYDNDLLVDKTYNVYLDPYGNAIGIDLYSGDDNYVFITGVDLDSSNISLGTAKAAAIFTDGTMKTITVDVKDTNKNIEKVDAFDNNGAPLTSSDANYNSYFEQWVDEDVDDGGIKDKAFVVNRWYTYTTDGNNTYTLNPATRMFTTEVTAAQVAANELDGIIKCNSVVIDEQASEANNSKTVQVNGAAAGRNAIRAYGNDDSIYIVVEAEEKVSKSGAKVISDVTGVYTGVQSVEIEINTTGKTTSSTVTGTELVDQIYTLYDKNNYIIASVVLGEARGSNANYAFILTAGTSEELLSDGTHQWTFDAVVEGKITTLTARSKFTKTIFGLEPGHIQELRYDGDYVVGVKTPDDATKYYTDPTSGRIDDMEIYDVGHVAKDGRTTEASGSIWAGAPDCDVSAGNHVGGVTSGRIDTGFATDLRVEGRTMYLKPANSGDYGLTFVENAPAVVIQKYDGKTQKLQFSSVKAAIGALGDPITGTSKKEFQGRIVAVLNDQDVAEWVVFISDTPTFSAGSGGSTGGSNQNNPPEKDFKVFERTGASAVTVRYYDDKFGTSDAMTSAQVRDYAKDVVSSSFGYDVKSIEWDPTDNTGDFYLDNGSALGVGIDVTTVRVVRVTVDGEAIVDADGKEVGYIDATDTAGTQVVAVADGNYILGTAKSVADGNEKTVTGGTGFTYNNGTEVDEDSTDEDVALHTAYQVNIDQLTGGSVKVKGAASNLADDSWVVTGTTVVVTGTSTGDDLTHQLYAADSDAASPHPVGDEHVVATGGSGTPATGEFVVNNGDVTFTESIGAVVKLDGVKIGVVPTSGADQTISFTGKSEWDIGTKFAAAGKNATDDHFTALATGSVTGTKTGYTYTYDAGDAVGGVIDLIPVVEVTLGANTKGDYEFGDPAEDATTINGSGTPTKVYMKVGTTLTVTGTTTSDNDHYIALGGTKVAGSSNSDSTGSTGAEATYEVKEADLGKILAFTEEST